jgi:1,4-alpha-glucan branching enzyme
VEELLARHEVTHTVVDGPTLQSAGAALHRPHRIAQSDVVAFGRDLALTYRVWSPRKGYPGSPWYQDFHTFDHEWGVRSSRVTHRTSHEKKPYDLERAREQITKDAADFLATARQIMVDSNESDPLVTVAYDTELFGHWWHEGPLFLDAVLDGAADAGIELSTLERERERAFDQPPVELNAGSWGSGKDFRVWEDGEAGELREIGKGTQYAVVEYLRSRTPHELINRDITGDAIVTELLLGLASDWAFMITKDSAADYARHRAHEHLRNVAELVRSDHHDSCPEARTRDIRLPFVDSRLARTH